MAFLTFKQVFEYWTQDATPSSRNISEGQEVLNANHLILVGLKSKSNEKVQLYALCLKSSALRDIPHEIEGWIEFVEIKGATIKELVCSCKAGKSSRCKHIAALLLFCTRSNIFELQVLSSTDLKCYWKNEKSNALKDYDPLPLVHTDEVVKAKISEKCKRYSNIVISEEKKKRILDDYCLVAPECALAKHRRGRRSTVVVHSAKFPTDILAVLNNARNSVILHNLAVMMPTAQCCKSEYVKISNGDFCNIAYETAQNKFIWLSERQFRITGSRCYDLSKYSKGDWQMKTKKYFWPKNNNWQARNKFIQHGLATEEEACLCYKTNNNYFIARPGLIVCERHPWLAYSPDGIVLEEGRPTRLLEIKCPFAGKTKPAGDLFDGCEFLILNETGQLDVKKNHQYYGQVQLGMILLNLPVCDFVN